ncbi:FMN-binding negative transcriptional regulator [Brevibacterium sp. FAM 24638]|uniref:FMN-binding negative transcriptional regulator n=1 Tax=unclassified Brevibacterium TaxID=2614124 RepID=UPI003C7A52AB
MTITKEIMHTYPNYPAPSGRAEVELVKTNPFALLVTNGTERGQSPIATHLPIVFPPDSEVTTELTGHRLWGHLGRKNTHWQSFAEQPEALAVFSTSQAYVSPSNYHFTPAAPTLNYAAVHLTGTITIFDDEADSLAVVEHTVEALEGQRTSPWSPEGSHELFRKIISGVVSFAFDVTGATSMFKLSQDMPEQVHERVAHDLDRPGCPHADVAGLMRQTGVHKSTRETGDNASA